MENLNPSLLKIQLKLSLYTTCTGKKLQTTGKTTQLEASTGTCTTTNFEQIPALVQTSTNTYVEI